MQSKQLKPLEWVGTSLEDIKNLPDEVRQEIGHALYLAQTGDKHPDTKPLKGFSGASVLEVVEDFDSNTYRAVYTVKLKKAVYVLHVFQKKSKHGIATPKKDIELIEKRLQIAKEHHGQKYLQDIETEL